MFAVKNRKIFFWISGAMVLVSFLLIGISGFNVGADFKGGTILEVRYFDIVPEKTEVEDVLTNLNLGNVSVRRAGDSGFIIRMNNLSISDQDLVKNSLDIQGNAYEIERLNSVGPTIGKELQQKAIIAIVATILITILFIAYSFRQISKPISSWVFGLTSIVALIHDISIPAGVAVILGKYAGMEIDALFITALLSLLGYSINDTIIIFDRIRENIRLNDDQNKHEHFETVVGRSLSETYGRSINTSLTLFLVLVSLFLFGGESIKFFILILIVGTVSGAYSSIFIAAPLLVSIDRYLRNKQK
jgi:preprotein translocase subunit SecF